MAFSLANSSGVPGSNAQANTGPELKEIAVESIGFNTFAGETKIKLLPSPWPTDALPSSTSSLFSISSTKGLLAAAGPDALIVSETKAVRAAFDADVKADKGIKPFDASKARILSVPRLSHVAFTSDGAYLIICAEDGGGLAVYATDYFQQADSKPAFMIGTDSVSVRALAPNPAPELAHSIAVVLSSGHLMIANLQSREFVIGGNGSKVLKEGVSCVSWSVKGKQLVAGLGDGNAFQLDQAGAPKAIIKQPPEVGSDHHVSSIIWLSNDEFLLIHTPNGQNPDFPDAPPESVVHYVQTDKNRSIFNYQKVQDPSPAFGLNRVPPTHYVSRLRKWNHLDDLLIFAAVVSFDVGLITRSEVPLTSTDANEITNVYTLTSFADDSRRATLPMSAIVDMEDTTPIGMALDLSSTDKVKNPIPGDELEQSPFPLPAMMLLNHEGVLAGWWIVVNDAIRENKIYPGLVIAEGNTSAASAAPPTQMTSPFSPTASSQNDKPTTPSWVQTGIPKAAATPFGGVSAIGQKASPWSGGSTPSKVGVPFGQPAFGQPSAFATPAPTSAGIGFGAAGAIGQKQSVWSTTSNNFSKTAAPFGSSTSGPQGFAKFSATNNAPSAFSASSSQTPLSPFAQQAPKTDSLPAFAASGTSASPTAGTSFGMSTQPSFGSTVTIDSSTGGSTQGGKSIFGTPSQPASLFGQPSLRSAPSQESDMMDDGDAPKEKTSGIFGLGPTGFKLGSTFKPGTSKAELDVEDDAPKNAPKKPLFGADFGAAIDDGKKGEPKIKEEPGSPPSLFGIPQKKDEPRSLFGQPSSARTTPSIFGQPSAPIPSGAQSEPPEVTSKPQPSPSPATGPSSNSQPSDSNDEGSIEEEGSESDAGSPAEAVEMPESDDEESDESEEVVDDAPLPPDPSTVKTRPSWFNEAPPGASASPATQKMPPPKAPSPPPPPPAESPLFPTKTTTPIGVPRAPIAFAKPMSSLRESPRSPSPVRSASTPVGNPFGQQLGSSRPLSYAVAPTPSRQQAPPPPPEPADTASNFSDDDDERIRLELEADIEPTLQLRDFIAHQDYVGKITKKDGLPNQIERMYRDINSMVDTLGLNARTLAAFIQGHEELQKDSRTKEDLDITDEDEDEWCLVEVEELDSIEEGLEAELDAATIPNPHQSILALKQMRKDLLKTRQKLTDVRKFLDDTASAETKAKIKAAPLDSAHANKQRELRAKFSDFQTKLVKAEEGAVVLRAKLAGAGGAGSGGRVPTVEAVEKTIRKMTAMAEERSGDIDVLERQMRSLGLVSDSRPSSSSRMGASLRFSGLFSSPKRNGGGRTFGLPEEDEDETDGEDGYLLSREVGSERVVNVIELRERRRAARAVVREAVRRRGVRVVQAS